MPENIKRLFFGMKVCAPWPHQVPSGRILAEDCRHMTLAFLGNVPYAPLEAILNTFPKPNFKVGLSGFFNKYLLLPPHHPNVVAAHIQWLSRSEPLLDYQQTIVEWLKKENYAIDDRKFLPHVTMVRTPFSAREWKESFEALPCSATNINLYESLGSLQYQPIWKLSILPPFEEIEHTADIAFNIHGERLEDLFANAFSALAFRFPSILHYFTRPESVSTLEEIVELLNRIVSKADSEIGCPFKAVSYHGSIKEENTILKWEMIVDV